MPIKKIGLLIENILQIHIELLLIDGDKVFAWFRMSKETFQEIKRVSFGIACILSGLKNISKIIVGPSNSSSLSCTLGRQELGLCTITFDISDAIEMANYKMIKPELFNKIKVNLFNPLKENTPNQESIQIPFREFAMRFPGS